MKKYTVTTETNLKEIPPFLSISTEYCSKEDIMCCTGMTMVDATPKKSLVSFEISQEVFDFIENTFNTEFDLYGEKTYVCNKIRMQIKEKQ
jgi:hypothetical protein